jgi:G3E family GTPase
MQDVKESYMLDAVLTVVDAKHVTQHLDEVKPHGVVNEAVQQVAFADKLLLNKLDLVDEEQKKAVISRIRVRGEVAMDLLPDGCRWLQRPVHPSCY